MQKPETQESLQHSRFRAQVVPASRQSSCGGCRSNSRCRDPLSHSTNPGEQALSLMFGILSTIRPPGKEVIPRVNSGA
jgi:hypothetical protein